MAGPFAILDVPFLIFLSITPSSGSSQLIPTSTATISAPAYLESAPTPHSPFAKLGNCIFVISCELGATPSSYTPWSAPKAIIAFLGISNFSVSYIPAICTQMSSTLPRLPFG